MLSLVIPVYKNEENLNRLLRALEDLNAGFPEQLEIVFVVDGSPDRCYEILRERLPQSGLHTQLLLLSRNFGSFSAIAAGMEVASGQGIAVLAADLQEPPELVAEFSGILRSNQADIVFGVRASRSDPWLPELFSTVFWWIYRRFVVPEMPPGGVDVFGCTSTVRDRLLMMGEVQTNLIALLFWMGFRRSFVPYHRKPRLEGMSAWTFAKKLRYSVDSIFNFTDLPLRLLMITGASGCSLAAVLGIAVIVLKVLGKIEVPGYTALMLTIMFFGALTTLGLGIVGQYLWLALQNTRKRPNYIVRLRETWNTPDPGANANRAATINGTLVP